MSRAFATADETMFLRAATMVDIKSMASTIGFNFSCLFSLLSFFLYQVAGQLCLGGFRF